MITEITTIEHVEQFKNELVSKGCIFHCDDDFNDYINLDTRERSFTPDEADSLNDQMSQCFAVCEKLGLDIYEIMFVSQITTSCS
jgi:hypothetical protein